MPVVLVAGILLVTAGCATAPPPLPPPKVLQPGDLRSLAGQWQGNSTGAIGSGPFAGRSMSVRVTFGEDGTFTSIVDNVPGRGTARIADGKNVYEGSGSRGTAQLYETSAGAGWLLRGGGTLVGFPGWNTFELTRR
jgi:hypothetical protein